MLIELIAEVMLLVFNVSVRVFGMMRDIAIGSFDVALREPLHRFRCRVRFLPRLNGGS